MPFRFRPSVKLGKGARLNLGKRGPSFSLRSKSGSVNLNSQGARQSVRLGKGLSYQTKRGSGCLIPVLVALLLAMAACAAPASKPSSTVPPSVLATATKPAATATLAPLSTMVKEPTATRPAATAAAQPTSTKAATSVPVVPTPTTPAVAPTATMVPAASTKSPALPTATTPAAIDAGVPPISRTECPASHPIKGNIRSDGDNIYHVKGQSSSYNATVPEVCFATVADAEAAGFRAPKN